MASRVVNRGLLRIGQQAFESTNYNAARNLQVLSIDDNAVAFGQTDTTCSTRGATTTFYDQAFDATPTESGQTITCLTTILAANGAMTIKSIAIHDDTAANTTATSSTLVAGIDGLTIVKDTTYGLALTLQMTFTSV